MEFVAFPKVDRNRISMMLTLPTSTSLESTTRYMERITSALEQVREEFVDPGSGESLIQNVSRTIGAEYTCLLYTSPSPRDQRGSRMPSSA